MRPWGAIALNCALVVAATLAFVSSAKAEEFGIVPGGVEVRTLDSEGNPDTRAGAHPDRLELSFKLSGKETGTSARDYVFEFDSGLTGSPSAGPACPRADLEEDECPSDTQIGVFTVVDVTGKATQSDLYNVAPAPNQFAAMGTKVLWRTSLAMALRPSDYGVEIQTTDFPQLPVYEGHIELWGVPADHLLPEAGERVPLLTTPTRCAPLKVTFKTRSWEPGAPWLSETAESLPFTGCKRLPFDPRLSFALDTTTTDSPAGARIGLSLPARGGPDETVSAHIRDVKVDLPPGLTISLGGIEGLEACSDARFGVGTRVPADCPFHSRVGSVEISAPAFREPLLGAIYLGREIPGERFRLFVVAKTQGVELKLQGGLVPDPSTGQLKAVLGGLPQVSFEHVSLNLSGGPRALLATPLNCGPTTTRASFAPYSGAASVESSAVVDIVGRGDAGCAGSPSFVPRVEAGSTRSVAGKDTGFILVLTRQDGEQLIRRLSATLPAGITPALGVVEPCPSSAAAAGSCPDTSRVGSAEAEIGSGSTPARVRGDVYLTDAYRGAPFGLSIALPAALGPFDLGTLQVRGTLRIDSRTGGVTIETDRLPSIFEGVPLRFKTIAISLDRPGLLRNPTSCKAGEVVSFVNAVDGRTASVRTPFKVRGCKRLRFRPRLRATLTDRSELHHGGHPGLRIAARMGVGGVNLRGFKLRFPRLVAFHGAGLRSICARGDAIEGLCPPSTRVGTGVARTPMLTRPLRGPVYLVQPDGKGLPSIWSSLAAAGVKIDVQSRTLRRGGRLATKIVEMPDMPLTSFRVHLHGGKRGLFSLRRGLCSSGRLRRLMGPAAAWAQNGAYRLMRFRLGATTACGRRKTATRQRSVRPLGG